MAEMLLFLLFIIQSVIPVSKEDWWWLAIRNILPIAVIVGFLWRLAIRPINEKLEKINNPIEGSLALVRKDLGRDITEVGKKVDAQEKSGIECSQFNRDQERELSTLRNEVNTMRDQFAETKVLVKELRDAIVDSNQKTHNLLGTIHVDIARLDEKLVASKDIKEMLGQMFTQLRRES